MNLLFRPSLGAALGKEDPESAEEVHIPNYVMLDFGLLEGRGTSGKSSA
jgi:hypothetical protein